MTVHQLHYTSCEDGLEGIQGFQISAMTPGAPKPLVDLAVRASAYEVGPDLMARLADADLGTFPVAFGYVPSGAAATLFQSRYIGSDFTGRTGNYFAHALLLDDADAELSGVLPIDMWRSPTWVHTRHNGTALPAVTALAPGGATDPTSIRRFLREPGRYDRLARMISATQRVLGGGRGRLVLVVPDDHSAALWLAALCRSLPRAVGLDVSFVTYTARPADTTVLVSCTTPDVRLPTYGDFTVVDLTDSGLPDSETTRYGAIMARLWESDGVPAAVQLADRAAPPLAGADLEAFAVLLECTTGSLGATPPEPLLLDAARLAVDRLPGALAAGGWRGIGDLLADAGGPTDLAAWSETLRAAGQRREPVAPELLGAYYIAALAAPQRLWLPALAGDELDAVAEHAVLPALSDPRAEAVLDRLGEQRELVHAVVRVLDRRLTDDAELRRLATTLTPRAARLIRQSSSRDPARLTDLVLARHGQADRVAVLAAALGDESVEWWHLGEVLWPEQPSAEEATQAIRKLHLEVLTGTGLLARITERLIRQADRDEVSAKDVRLVDVLLEQPIVGEIEAADAAVLAAVRLIDQFRQSTPKRDAGRSVREGLELLDTLPGAIGDRMLVSIAEFTLRAEPEPHRELLTLALSTGSKRFLNRYRELATDRLAKAAPPKVAGVIVIWSSLANTRVRTQLLNETLPAAIARRRAKHLDAIGAALVPTAKKLAIDAPAAKGWRDWWKSWRSRHERRGLLGLLGLRRKSQ
ncbi:MAG TPA: GTPase-associated protein 1-related protein [Actinophytocola sp.]|uniref:GTPase-associated protein 1-related protein n=1 Tax=Actinophytocola sp. TaxID=1872138 RepID=UPI002DDCF33F|nr:GTPase-associated protein 1-related protein [Actinophytocola sp.]HEV2781163.1 GTPase-associated protein 1-related protein [Actinophytocola sp.]